MMVSKPMNPAKYATLIYLLVICCLIGFVTICEAQSPWTAKTDMPTERYWVSCEAVNGKIYVIGGVSGQSQSALAIVEEYDPVNDTWITKKDMPTPRRSMMSAVVDGKIYVIGGDIAYIPHETNGLQTLEVYDSISDNWDTTKTEALIAREGGTACVVDGIVYVMGGVAPGGNFLRDVEAYDPASDTWSKKASMNYARHALRAATVDGKIYAIGEGRGGRMVEEYNPKTNEWRIKADMPVSNGYFGCCVIEGIIYTIGGASYPSYTLSQVFVYDPSADKWSEKAAMPTARVALGAATVNGKCYAIGGAIALPIPLAIVEVYDPSCDLTTLISDFNVNKSFALAGSDSVCISATVTDPAGVTLLTVIKNPDQSPVESLELYDDGNHLDGNAGDLLYANVWPASTEEQLYHVDLQVTRESAETVVHQMSNMAVFTTIGPVVFHSVSSRNADDVLEPDASIRLYVTLKNNVKTATATNLEAQLVCYESSWVDISSDTKPYDDMAPGQTMQNSTSYRVDILDTYPGDTAIPMEVHISSNDQLFWNDTFSIPVYVGVKTEEEMEPEQFSLYPNYPNPFNPTTTIQFDLPEFNEVTLKVFTLRGEEVETLVSQRLPAGEHTVQWNAMDQPGGVYLVRLAAKGFVQTRKMILMK